jgi:hypothetical protein
MEAACIEGQPNHGPYDQAAQPPNNIPFLEFTVRSHRLVTLSGWVILSLTLIGLTVSCIVPEGGRRGGWHGDGEWHERG